MFFSFDGIDGVGKSTQLEKFVSFLRDQGHDLVTCRDPGSTQLGEAVRDILLNDQTTQISPVSEMLLYMAARAQLVEEVIAPAVNAGQTVVSDRFLLSNVAYQGYGGGLGAESVWQVGQIATRGVLPDLTFVLDMDPVEATRRLGRSLDRMEQRGDDYRQKLRDGFLAEAGKDPAHITVIDAGRSADDVHTAVCEAALRVLK